MRPGGIRKKFERGEIRVNTTKFVGYDKWEDGNLVINPQQAKIVRQIFRDFLQGETPESIARSLKEEGVPGWNGKANWYPTTIQRMLQNEKYMGDALLQKTYTVDFLTKKRSENQGQVNQYYLGDLYLNINSTTYLPFYSCSDCRRTFDFNPVMEDLNRRIK